MTVPILSGRCELQQMTDGGRRVYVPGGVTVPPGYELRVELSGDVGTFHVVPMAGLWAWWLRWWYPYRVQ